MGDRAQVRVWTRMHTNGMMAVVHTIPDDEGRFAFGALVPGGPGSLGEVVGFDAAKAAADKVSGCAQPCACPLWSD